MGIERVRRLVDIAKRKEGPYWGCKRCSEFQCNEIELVRIKKKFFW
jgi:hypothetical protein